MQQQTQLVNMRRTKFNRISWASWSYSLHLYLWGAKFEWQPGNWLSWIFHDFVQSLHTNAKI